MSRSQPGADRQGADLERAGHAVVVAPVIRVEASGAAAPAGTFDVVVFVSEHAVRSGLPVLRGSDWFLGARVLAVGGRTGRVLADAGVPAQVPAAETSEGLLDVDALESLDGARVLLVSGVGGRELLAEELTRRGAAVARFACYRREPVGRLDPRVLGCEAIVAASGEGLRQAARLWLEAGGRADVPVLVPSARVAALGVELGLASLHDCGGADSASWLEALERLQRAGGK